MSTLKKLAGDTVIYGVSTMLGRLISYLLVPLHTALFGGEQLAVQVQLYSYAAAALVIYTFGMETAFFRFATSSGDLKKYYNVVLSAVIIVSLALSGAMYLFSDEIAMAIKYPDDAKLVRWFAIIFAVDAIVSIPLARLRLERKAIKFVAIRFSNILIYVFLNIFFLVICRDIYEGKYLQGLTPLVGLFYDPAKAADSIILANLIASPMMLPMLWRELREFSFVISWEVFKPVWVYAYPIFIMNLAAVTNMVFDRSFLQFLLPPNYYPGLSTEQAIGIYGTCFKLSIFMNLAIQAFKYAAEPFFFSKGEDKDAPETFAVVMKWFIIVCVIMWVGISLNLELLGFLFLRSREYWVALNVVPWLLAGFLFLGIYYNLATWFKLTGKTQYGTYLTLIGASTTILLNVTLVPRMGYLGSAIAFASSSVLMTVLNFWLGQKFYPVPYHIANGLAYIVTAALVIVIGARWRFESFNTEAICSILATLIFISGIFLVERKNFPTLRKKPSPSVQRRL